MFIKRPCLKALSFNSWTKMLCHLLVWGTMASVRVISAVLTDSQQVLWHTAQLRACHVRGGLTADIVEIVTCSSYWDEGGCFHSRGKMFTKNALVRLTGLYWLRFSAALGHRHLLMHPSVVTTVRTPRHTHTNTSSLEHTHTPGWPKNKCTKSASVSTTCSHKMHC